jgi:hypothetical protein
MGSYFVQAIFQRDFAVVQAAVLLMVLAVLAANLVNFTPWPWRGYWHALQQIGVKE